MPDGLHILRETLPLIPGHAIQQHLLRHGLHIDQVPRDNLFLLRATRRNTHPAVAHQDAGHPVPARTGEQRVPGDLRVVMSMNIDKTRRDHAAVGVDCPRGRSGCRANVDDNPILDSDSTVKEPRASTVTNLSVRNEQVVGHASPLYSYPNSDLMLIWQVNLLRALPPRCRRLPVRPAL